MNLRINGIITMSLQVLPAKVWLGRSIGLLLALCFTSPIYGSPAHAIDPALKVETFQPGKLNPSAPTQLVQAEAARQQHSESISDRSAKTLSSPVGDNYSLAPAVQDSEFSHHMTETQASTTQVFDQSSKTLGDNRFGSAGGKLRVVESITDLGNGEVQITVQVTAVNAQGQAEPWVNMSFF